MREPTLNWRPGATLERLRRRATMLAAVRKFFSERGVLEVDTAQLVNHAVTDLNLVSAQVRWPDTPAGRQATTANAYLHTSPEYAMKRLLAAGSGDIYQMCHVFRGEEQGPLHNCEFMIVEWYRQGWALAKLMREVDDFVRQLLTEHTAQARYLTYQDSFREALDIDPLTASDATLVACACARGLDAGLVQRCERDELLDLLMGALIGPKLGWDGPVFLHRYPASQAALARLDVDDPRVALRFEFYLNGVELANGFEELADADEQRSRFAADQCARAARNLSVPAMDQFLLAALAAGLPPCSGVALGLDRLLMLACGAQRIEEVLPFTGDRA